MPKTARRFDAITPKLVGKMERTEEGYLKGNAILTRTGVFPYRLSDGSVVMELRHPDDVFEAASLASMHNLPITLQHPVSEDNPTGLVNADNAKDVSIGNTGETVQPDGPNVRATLAIRDKSAIDQIEAGQYRENSMGYEADLVEEMGEYNGQRYDMRQRRIRYNHLAIVDRARMGAEARLNLDSADAVQASPESVKKEERTMAKVKLDSGIEYDAAPEVVQELTVYKGRVAKAEGKLDGLTDVKLDDNATGKADAQVAKHLGKVQGQLDQAQADLKKLQKEGPKATLDAARARITLLQYGASVLDEDTISKLDEMPDIDIRKAVILATTPEGSRESVKTLLDSKEGEAGAAYIEARFDAATQGINLRDSSAIRNQHHTLNPVVNNDAGDGVPDADSHRQAMIDRYNGKATTKAGEDK